MDYNQIKRRLEVTEQESYLPKVLSLLANQAKNEIGKKPDAIEEIRVYIINQRQFDKLFNDLFEESNYIVNSKIEFKSKLGHMVAHTEHTFAISEREAVRLAPPSIFSESFSVCVVSLMRLAKTTTVQETFGGKPNVISVVQK